MSETDAPSDVLEAALAAAAKARVGVFGDFCLDAYWEIDADESERSLETHLPVRRVRRQRTSLGGAGNVVANLAALGVSEVRAVALLGADMFGAEMRRLLADAGADLDGVLVHDDWQTQVYAKPILGGDETNRIDFGAFNALAPAVADALAARLADAADACDAVILNQQVPAGVSTPGMIDRVNAVVADHPACRFVVDSRHRAELYRGAALKLNAREAADLAGASGPDDATDVAPGAARPWAEALARRTGREVFVTCGAGGMVVADAAGTHVAPGVNVPEPTDPVGAGDAAVAAIAAALAGGGDALSAARLANLAAAVTVGKLHVTGTATPAEIRSLAADRPGQGDDRA